MPSLFHSPLVGFAFLLALLPSIFVHAQSGPPQCAQSCVINDQFRQCDGSGRCYCVPSYCSNVSCCLGSSSCSSSDVTAAHQYVEAFCYAVGVSNIDWTCRANVMLASTPSALTTALTSNPSTTAPVQAASSTVVPAATSAAVVSTLQAPFQTGSSGSSASSSKLTGSSPMVSSMASSSITITGTATSSGGTASLALATSVKSSNAVPLATLPANGLWMYFYPLLDLTLAAAVFMFG